MADWLWNPRPMYTHAGYLLHYAGPKALLELPWKMKDGTLLISDAIAVCGAWGNEGVPPEQLKDCEQCVRIINLCRSGARVELGTVGGKSYSKPKDVDVVSALRGTIPDHLLNQVLTTDSGDRVFDAINFGVNPLVAAKRIINDVTRYKTPWNIALRLMKEESDGTDYHKLRDKYKVPSPTYSDLVIIANERDNRPSVVHDLDKIPSDR